MPKFFLLQDYFLKILSCQHNMLSNFLWIGSVAAVIDYSATFNVARLILYRICLTPIKIMLFQPWKYQDKLYNVPACQNSTFKEVYDKTEVSLDRLLKYFQQSIIQDQMNNFNTTFKKHQTNYTIMTEHIKNVMK